MSLATMYVQGVKNTKNDKKSSEIILIFFILVFYFYVMHQNQFHFFSVLFLFETASELFIIIAKVNNRKDFYSDFICKVVKHIC